MSLIQRQPTNTIGMRADWSMPPAKDRKIHVSKSELAVRRRVRRETGAFAATTLRAGVLGVLL